MWRAARPEEDELIVQMCQELNREDPGPEPVEEDQMRHTLAVLRREPYRGRGAVLEIDGRVVGYALLIAYWSNEFGGELCEVDEFFVSPEHRNRGYGRSLFDTLENGEIWGSRLAAVSLGVSSNNARARRLYESLGFKPVGTSMVRRFG
jgi:ribosomal protein S18 acetylase RimI-like enzyme